MSRLRAAVPHGLRVILCLKFSHSAPFHELAEIKNALLQDENVLHSVEVSGSYDFMAEMQLADLADYQAMLDGFSARFGHLIEHYEASFICRRFVRESDGPSAHFWVPSGSGPSAPTGGWWSTGPRLIRSSTPPDKPWPCPMCVPRR